MNVPRVMVLLVGLAGACADANMPLCEVGRTAPCACSGGGTGEKRCDGRSWGPCLGCGPLVGTADSGLPPGTEGGPCFAGGCGRGLICAADNRCVKAADLGLGDGFPLPDGPSAPSPDTGPLPDTKPTPTPDTGPTCTGGLLDSVLAIGDSRTVSHQGSSVVLTVADIGVSGSGPAVLLEIDGKLSVVNIGKSETSGGGFTVTPIDVQHLGAADSRWVRLCVTFP